jgi:hypothetical protein
MSKNKTHTEKTAAEATSIGFDYQYYFFLWKVISLLPNESVGLEVKDDVHCDLSNNYQLLYQLKHTIKKNTDESPANLTTSDRDMWKTFSNWSKVISDPNDSRSTKKAQLDFLKKTSFVLASNKSSNKSNKVVQIINDLQGGTKNEEDVCKYFESLKNSTGNDTLKDYINDVLCLDLDVLKGFLINTFFHLDNDDILKKCKEAIKSKMVPLNKIDHAFAKLDSSIRADNFLLVKDKVKIEISFDTFYDKYRRHFDIYRNGSLNIQEYKGALPDCLEDQVFIKQLLEIGFIESDDFEYISELTRFKLKLLNNLESWKHDGEILDSELDKFKKNAHTLWNNEFRFQYMGSISEEEYNKKGAEILRTVLKNNLKLDGQKLDVDLCNGTFYSLSDEPIIGWRKDWEKYKK